MRTILAVTIAASFILLAWWNYSLSADAGTRVAKSINPAGMTSNVPDMPQYVGP